MLNQTRIAFKFLCATVLMEHWKRQRQMTSREEMRDLVQHMLSMCFDAKWCWMYLARPVILSFCDNLLHVIFQNVLEHQYGSKRV